MSLTPTLDRSLEPYVDRIAAEWDLDVPDRLWRDLDATLCFVDISGFTNLSEKLASLGRIGAEELTEVLNYVFGEMLEMAYARGGALLKFGGDALLLLFEGDDHAVQGVSAAIEMRAALREAAGYETSVGKLKLRMSIGVHSGPIHLFRVGRSHRELVIAGPGASITTEMEKHADPGEIVISSGTRALLPSDATTKAKGPGWILRWRKPRARPEGPVLRRDHSGDDLSSSVPQVLGNYLCAVAPESEHRLATVAFVRIAGTDALIADEGSEAVATALDQVISVVQEAADAEGVTFLASDINDDGCKIVLTTGVPSTQADDEGRMLRAVRQIADADLTLPVRIGVNRGHVFSGEVGTTYRATYTVMGDTVNTAARLMAAAPAGAIYASPGVLAPSGTLFDTTALEPLQVKGKTQAVPALSVGEEIGPRSSDAAEETPFTGRSEEVEVLVRGLQRLASGTGGTVTLAGKAGSGKTRLVQEALRSGPEVDRFSVRAEPYGTVNPYRPFRDPVRELLDVERDSAGNMAKQLTEHVDDVAPHLRPFLTLIGDLAHIDVTATPEVDAIGPRFRRDRLADIFIELLGLERPEPLLIIAEDAHWMDEASTHLLSRLATATTSHPWLLLTVRRDENSGFVPDAGETIELGPLDTAYLERIIITATEAAPLRPHEIDDLVRRSGGNPLFLEELIRAVREAGGTEDLPDSLDAVVGAEIDSLPPLARQLLRHASVLGRSFRMPVLQETLADEPVEMDAATRTILDRFLEDDGADRLRFRQALVRDAAYQGLSFRRRRQLHLRAGEATEALSQDGRDSVADVLALHFSLAGRHDKAWRYARIAGDRARLSYANVEAAAHYERALDSGRRLPEVPLTELSAVWVELGDVRERVGLFDDALDAYRRASRLVGDDPLALSHTQYKRGRARERSGDFSVALREITVGQRMIEHLDEPEAAIQRARLTSLRAIVLQGQEKPQRALAVAAHARESADRVGATDAKAHAGLVMHWAHLMLGLPGGERYGEEALLLYEELGDLERQAAMIGNLGAGAYFAGRWEEALKFYERGHDTFTRAGNAVEAAMATTNSGEVLVNQRRLEEAEPLLRNSARVQRASGFNEGAALAEMHLGRALTQQGEVDEAFQLLLDAYNQFTELGRIGSVLEAATHLAENRLVAGQPDEALETLDRAEEAAGGTFSMYAANAARVRSSALAAHGRVDEAVAVADEGLAIAGDLGLDYECALLLVTRADLANQTGHKPDAGQIAKATRLLADLGIQSQAGSQSPN